MYPLKNGLSEKRFSWVYVYEMHLTEHVFQSNVKDHNHLKLFFAPAQEISVYYFEIYILNTYLK